MQTEETTIGSLMIIVTLVMLIMAVSIVFFILFHQRRVIKYQLNLQRLKEDQQKLLLRAAIESEEKERKRIAGDLHDEVGASLATVRLYLMQSGKEASIERVNATTANAKQILDDIIQKVRQISHQLSPETLKEFGLQEALGNLAQKVTASGAIQMECRSEGPIPRLSPDKELAIYRIAQELLNNTLKHAGAAHISLTLKTQAESLKFIMQDDGRGFNQQSFETLKSSPNGLGLKNIQSRADILNASINFGERKEGQKGTRMVMEVPVSS